MKKIIIFIMCLLAFLDNSHAQTSPTTTSDDLNSQVWTKQSFILPQIGFGESNDITEIELVITMHSENAAQILERKSARWTTKTGWQESQYGKTTNAIHFGLLGYNLNQKQMENIRFEGSTIVRFNYADGSERSPFIHRETLKTIKGEEQVIVFESYENVIVSVDPSIDWRQLGLSSINVQIKSGKRIATTNMRLMLINNVVTPPIDFIWLVGNGKNGSPDPVNIEIRFIFRDGKTQSWTGNGDLRAPNRSLRIELNDADIKNAKKEVLSYLYPNN